MGIHCEAYWLIFDKWQPALDLARVAGGLEYLEEIAKMDHEMKDHEQNCKACKGKEERQNPE